MEVAIVLIVGAALCGAVLYYFLHKRDVRYPVPERLYAVKHAIANERDLEIVYFTYKSQQFHQRTVTPIELFDELYLRAFDHWRQDMRTFKLSRMREVREAPRREIPLSVPPVKHRRRKHHHE